MMAIPGNNNLFLAFFSVIGLFLLTASAFARDMEPMDTAVLQGLDKVTARVSTTDVPVGNAVRFGTLHITVRACRKAPPIEQPEAAAFLEIVDQRLDESPVTLYSGWMFANFPALAALDHPIYDIWVIDCR
ncbi:MAG: DUF2155 domain-containing protein [Pseudomonadota bacterium]|nr:DUF2155 domain-containing protein [Pseudomonadota bacterium]